MESVCGRVVVGDGDENVAFRWVTQCPVVLCPSFAARRFAADDDTVRDVRANGDCVADDKVDDVVTPGSACALCDNVAVCINRDLPPEANIVILEYLLHNCFEYRPAVLRGVLVQ